MQLWGTLAIAASILSIADARAQSTVVVPATVYQEFGARLGREISREFRTLSGEWIVDVSPVCTSTVRPPSCLFRAPLPDSVVDETRAALVVSLRGTAERQASARALDQRREHLDFVRARGLNTQCWNAETDGLLAKIVRVDQMRQNADTLQAVVYVTQMGRLAGCTGSANIFRVTAVGRPDKPMEVRLGSSVHFETAWEVLRERY